MKDSQPIVPWMEHLSHLIPPSGVVVVGAGKGTGEWFSFLCELDDTPVILIEADPASFKFLEIMTASHPGWRIRNEVIAKETANVSFYQTTVSSENSLINPDQLLSLWPNLKAHQVQPRQALALEGLLGEIRPVANWLLIDCLPALPMIEGAGDALDAVDVIAARVITSTTVPELEAAGLQTLRDSLGTQGFRLQAVEISRHPSLGYALFIRSDCFGNEGTRQQLPAAKERIASLLQQTADTGAQIEALTRGKAQAETAAAESLALVQSLRETNSELMTRQQLMDEEIRKARIQIELLEKLFTTDPGT